jgi:hypothetical protein
MADRISIADLENMTQTKYVCTQKIKLADEVLGDNKKHILEFDIFDGFAYCANYQGKEYFMTFPKKEFIALSADMTKTAREYLNLDEHEPLREEHLLASYNTLHVNVNV